MPTPKEEQIHGLLTKRIDVDDNVIVPAEGGYRTIRTKTPGVLFKRIGSDDEGLFVPLNVLRASLVQFDAESEARVKQSIANRANVAMSTAPTGTTTQRKKK